jgi:cytosine/uracil/thiamine/allantoin permease
MRVWTWFSFVSLWWSQNYGAGSWSTGAALINAGLTFNQALGVSALGCILTSLVGVAAAVSHYAISTIPWFSLIIAASGCGIPYRFPSLVQKYVRNVGIKNHGRV